ncbi:hypothetical protein N0V90_010578 [Kalmusia sp. IMI 367209]|nr:hypothetical protein N0V90_010578 [Kalmusia sp. IMI 367209]
MSSNSRTNLCMQLSEILGSALDRTACVPSNDEPSLPSYLARHINIGFDQDDVFALINSIDASQDRNSSYGLPQLPAEILFHIVEYVPIAHILQWRLVCRGFRDCIDGPVMYSYLRRAEIIGYLGTKEDFGKMWLDELAYENIAVMRCRYERLENFIKAKDPRIGMPKWGSAHATFHIDDVWHELFTLQDLRFAGSENRRAWHAMLRALKLEGDPETYGKLKWCMCLDGAVLDLEIPTEALQAKLHVDLSNKTVTVKWRDLLFQFLKTETLLKATMDQPAEDFRRIERAESNSIALLMKLRREARMSKEEYDRLRQLADDRNRMVIEVNAIERVYAEWRDVGLGETGVRQLIFSLPKVPINPFSWSDEVRAAEEKRVNMWKKQQENMQQVVLLLQASIEAVSIPDNAFEDLGSDI